MAMLYIATAGASNIAAGATRFREVKDGEMG